MLPMQRHSGLWAAPGPGSSTLDPRCCVWQQWQQPCAGPRLQAEATLALHASQPTYPACPSAGVSLPPPPEAWRCRRPRRGRMAPPPRPPARPPRALAAGSRSVGWQALVAGPASQLCQRFLPSLHPLRGLSWRAALPPPHCCPQTPTAQLVTRLPPHTLDRTLRAASCACSWQQDWASWPSMPVPRRLLIGTTSGRVRAAPSHGCGSFRPVLRLLCCRHTLVYPQQHPALAPLPLPPCSAQHAGARRAAAAVAATRAAAP